MEQKINDYDDILYVSKPISLKHKPMSRQQRAAQFAPFAALTGHREAIDEASRYVENKKLLNNDQMEEINRQLHILKDKKVNHPIIIVYFKKDLLKEGGQYMTMKSYVKKIDVQEKYILLDNGNCINIQDIYNIDILDKEDIE